MNQIVSQPIRISDHLYQFNETNDQGPYVDSYLLIGENSAIVIDALQTDTGLCEAVRRITGKPLALFITHGHLDHAGVSVKEFHEAGIPIYMDLRDFDMLKEMLDYGEERDWFIDITPDLVFDLGGFRLKALPIPGHTTGSWLLWDEKNQIMFSGDGIGSGGIFLQLSCCSPMSEYQKSLSQLMEITGTSETLLIYPGHRNQSPVQLTGTYMKDVEFLVDGVLDGSLVGQSMDMPFGDGLLHFSVLEHGMMQFFCYNPQNL